MEGLSILYAALYNLLTYQKESVLVPQKYGILHIGSLKTHWQFQKSQVLRKIQENDHMSLNAERRAMLRQLKVDFSGMDRQVLIRPACHLNIFIKYIDEEWEKKPVFRFSRFLNNKQ